MKNLAIIRTENVPQYARSKGLGITGFPDDRTVEFELLPVRAILNGQAYSLPPVRLRNFGATMINLQEAIVRGRNLAVIHDDALLPSGYSHSFNWVEQGGFALSPDKTSCRWPPAPVAEIPDGADLFVLGITAHFGHFFTDCLDRLLAVDRAGASNAARYIIDGPPPAQVRQLIELLGIDFPESSWLMLDPAKDYHAKHVNVVTLRSAKPAISLATFQTLRERVLAKFPHPPSGARSIYVGRKAVQKRRILNQDDVVQKLGDANFAAFYPEEHGFAEAVEAFRAADVIVIVLGSSKFNLAFCRPGTRVIGLAPEGYVEKSGAVAVMLRQLCALFQLELCFCSCRVSGENTGLDSDLVIDFNDVNRALGTLGG